MNEMTNTQFADLFLYVLATSLDVAQIAQQEIDTITEETDNEN